ncbi:MAG TPA: hypothetical protein DCL77_00260 [Prolixibacteraceae bacterium]|jgi:hypothetical protein|nr:hypothetical protein [Prolixibacteraceae bacterium]
MNSYLKSFLLVIAVSFSMAVSGQINFKKGYVITLQNDTLHGRINDRGGYANARVCVFHQKKGPTFRYTPQDIKAYRMLNDKYYVSRRVYVRGKYRNLFVDVLLKGDVSLYHNWKNKDLAYYIEKKDQEMVGLINQEVMLRYKPEGNVAVVYSPTYILSNKIFKDTLRSFFSESKKIQDQVSQVEYDPKSLTRITKAYIHDVCKGNDCINYERDLRAYSPRFGVFAGIQRNEMSFLPSVKGVNSKAEPTTIAAKDYISSPIGIFVNFPLTKLNDRLSFQLEGVFNERLYHQMLGFDQNFGDTIQINTQTVSFPLLLKYQIGRGFITPSFAVGKEWGFVIKEKVILDSSKDLMIHPIQKGGWLAEAGLNFKLAKHLTLFSNVRYQTGKNMIMKNGTELSGYNTVKKSAHFVKEYDNTYTTLLVGLKF